MAQLTTAGPFAISLMMYILLMEGGNIFTQPTNTSVNWRGSIVGSVLSWYAWKPGFHPQIYLKWGGGAHLGNWDNAKAEAQAEVQGHCVSASECRAIPEYLNSHLKKGWSKYSTLSSLSLVQMSTLWLLWISSKHIFQEKFVIYYCQHSIAIL